MKTSIEMKVKAKSASGLLTGWFMLMVFLCWSTSIAAATVADSSQQEKQQVEQQSEEQEQQVILEVQADQSAQGSGLSTESPDLSTETQAILQHMEKAEERFRITLQEQRAAAQEQREAAKTRERILLGVLILMVVIVISAILVYTGRRKKNRTIRTERGVSVATPSDSKTVIQHRHGDTEYVLDGRDEEGVRYVLTLSGEELLDSDGVVIGRNPADSRYLINHADVSRRHAKMSMANNRVFIEDLGSTNGTSINGQSIDEKGPVAVANGDQLIIGSVVMKLNVLHD